MLQKRKNVKIPKPFFSEQRGFSQEEGKVRPESHNCGWENGIGKSFELNLWTSSMKNE